MNSTPNMLIQAIEEMKKQLEIKTETIQELKTQLISKEEDNIQLRNTIHKHLEHIEKLHTKISRMRINSPTESVKK